MEINRHHITSIMSEIYPHPYKLQCLPTARTDHSGPNPFMTSCSKTGYDVSELHTFEQEEPKLTIFVLPDNPNQPQE